MTGDPGPEPRAHIAAPAASVVVERPPPGILRGREAAAPWSIALLGILALLLLFGFYWGVLRKRRP